ncbi:hypothetical protein HQ487_04490 [Candidatus Uhrbacteria bacterium]|nr:hypothetical protein [Candidatus Uhrbacteria bacterium]
MTRKPQGYWNDWKNVEEALRPVIQDLGRFPTAEEVRALPYGGSLNGAIHRAGGYRMAAELTNTLGNQYNPSGYWLEWEHIEKAMRAIIDTHGHLPSRRRLNELGHSTLVQAISEYHGGTTAVCKRMGINPRQQPNGYWKNPKHAEALIHKLSKRFGHFPTPTEFKTSGHSGAMAGITRYHGGLRKFKRYLGYRTLSKDLLHSYADQIAQAFMKSNQHDTGFDTFVTSLLADCRFERDLRIKLGLPPELESMETR